MLRAYILFLLIPYVDPAPEIEEEPAPAGIKDIAESGEKSIEVLVGIYVINVESINSAD